VNETRAGQLERLGRATQQRLAHLVGDLGVQMTGMSLTEPCTFLLPVQEQLRGGAAEDLQELGAPLLVQRSQLRAVAGTEISLEDQRLAV
jgi:hypothetical protein